MIDLTGRSERERERYNSMWRISMIYRSVNIESSKHLPPSTPRPPQATLMKANSINSRSSSRFSESSKYYFRSICQHLSNLTAHARRCRCRCCLWQCFLYHPIPPILIHSHPPQREHWQLSRPFRLHAKLITCTNNNWAVVLIVAKGQTDRPPGVQPRMPHMVLPLVG